MKKILYILIIFAVLVGCSGATTGTTYNFAALGDTLNLKGSYMFVKECSPLYRDDNPYGLTEPHARVKTLFYQVTSDSINNTLDTIIYAVRRDNQIIFWGKSESSRSARTLIEWTINNRNKI